MHNLQHFHFTCFLNCNLQGDECISQSWMSYKCLRIFHVLRIILLFFLYSLDILNISFKIHIVIFTHYRCKGIRRWNAQFLILAERNLKKTWTINLLQNGNIFVAFLYKFGAREFTVDYFLNHSYKTQCIFTNI